jgi:hypothetical protein
MLDFPASPTLGQVFNPTRGLNFVADSAGKWKRQAGMALPSNRIINGSMLVSQQNGTTAAPANNVTGGTGYFAADQFFTSWDFTGGGGTFSSANYDTITGSSVEFKTVYINCTSAPTSLQAANIALISTKIEGSKIADFNWGVAGALPVILRFMVVCGIAGTYSVRVANATQSRSFIAQFTVAANVFTEVIVPIPGNPDGPGIWTRAETAAMRIDWVAAAGSNWYGVAGWQTGNFYALSGQTNGLATTSGIMHIGGVGLYLDPNNTGVPPPYQSPSYDDELKECMRYWYKAYAMTGVVGGATISYRTGMVHHVPMTNNPVPVPSLVGSTLRLYDGTVAPNLSSVANTSSVLSDTIVSSQATASGLTPGRPGMILCDGAETNYVAINGRM